MEPRIQYTKTTDALLVSPLFREITESAGEFVFCGERELEMKGLSGTHRVYAVVW